MAKAERIVKINAELERQLAGIIRELRNPELENKIISVSRVQTSADLYQSKVYISIYGTSEEKTKILDIIENAKGYIRRELAHKVDLRVVPELVFILDDSLEYSENINKIISSINETKSEN